MKLLLVLKNGHQATFVSLRRVSEQEIKQRHTCVERVLKELDDREYEFWSSGISKIN